MRFKWNPLLVINLFFLFCFISFFFGLKNKKIKMVVSIYFISVAYFSMKKGGRYWKWWKELVFREWNNMSGRNGGVLANL